MKVLVFVHRIFSDNNVKRGGIDYITDFLKHSGIDLCFVEHPLEGWGPTIISEPKNLRKLNLPFSGPTRWFFEFFVNSYILLKYASKEDLVIAVDPLNFIPAYLIRFVKNYRIQFHAVDYSENRFSSNLLNSIYRMLFNLSTTQSDIVTYVSKEMEKLICSNKQPTQIFCHVPNSPEYSKILRIDPVQKDKMNLVYTKAKISSSEYELLINTVKLVKTTFPEIALTIIGEVPQCSKTNLPNIKCTGLIPYKENMDIISSSYLGLAWYENIKSFEKYADSLKLREYAAAGVPAICNKGIATALEGEKWGAVRLAESAEELAKQIMSLIKEQELYLKTRENALAWARSNDKTLILQTLYKQLGLL